MRVSESSSPVHHWSMNFINHLDLPPTGKVLEFGCRDEKLALALAAQYPLSQFIAVSDKSAVVEKASANRMLNNVEFACEELPHLSANEEYDSVISSGYLHWVADKATIFKRIYSALKPGGEAHLQFFVLHGRPKNDRFLYNTAKKATWSGYFKQFIPDYHEIHPTELYAVIESSGLLLQRFEFRQHESVFEHPEQLMDWLSTWASPIHHLPRDKQKTFLADTVDQYLLANGFEQNREFSYYEYMIEVHCQKPIQNFDTRTFPTHLTPREILVLSHYLKGKSAKAIGLDIHVSAKAVEFHLANIRQKFNAHNRFELFHAVRNLGLLHLQYD